MKTTATLILCAIALLPTSAAAQTAEELRQPFAVLRDAYAVKDIDKAVQAYTPDAKIILQYPNMPREEYQGTAAIRESFVRVLKPIRPEWTLDMNFKLEAERAGSAYRTGLYRIAVNIGDRIVKSYGRFSVQLRGDNGVWRFSEDLSESATQADYDSAPGPEMFTRP